MIKDHYQYIILDKALSGVVERYHDARDGIYIW
jgi:hypothetical protein